MSVHDQLRHRRYGYSNGACVGDGLVSEGGRAMRSSVTERDVVGEMDEFSGRVAKVRKQDQA